MNPELDPKLAENQKPTVKLEMTVDEVNLVIAALQELPHRIADPLLRKLVQQGQAQLQQAPAA
jgi:hypothetical protein